jgi:hypothetical protein
MKTMKLWRNIFVMIAAILSLVSCSSVEKDGEKDGDWDSMVWKAEVPVVITTDGIYDVSVDGGKFTFVCQNYSSPWIECATSGESRYYPPRETNDYHTITADWFKAEIVGNKLSVTFDSNKDYNVRSLELSVTAGDIFYTFKFKQFGRN